MVLDFDVNIPAEDANVDSVESGPGMEPILEQICDVTRKKLLIPPGESLSGGVWSVEPSPGGTLPETLSPSSAPDPMPAGDQATLTPALAHSPAPPEAAARCTGRPAPRSEPALTRVRVASVPPRRQTRNGTASLAAHFEQRTLHNLRSLALYTNVDTQDIVHHLENALLLAEYAYISTASTGNHSGGGWWNKLKVPNTFEKTTSPPQAARGKASADKEIASLKTHNVTSWYLRPPSLLDKRGLAHTESTRPRRTTSSNVVWLCWNGRRHPGSTAAALSHPSVDCKAS